MIIQSCRSWRNKGFTLVEMAIVLVIIGLMLAALITPLGVQRDLRDYEEVRKELSEVREALVGFALSQPNAHLPCPDIDNDGLENRAGTGCSSPIGTLPWATIGLGQTDSWNAAYLYRVTDAFSDSNGFALASLGGSTILDAAVGGNTVAANIPVVIISKGKNGAGGGDDESQNDLTNDAIFVSHEQIDVAANQFDDVVVWIPAAILFNRMVAAGKLP